MGAGRAERFWGERGSLGKLREEVSGLIAVPGDAAYQELTTPWNLAVQMRPAVVVAPHDAAGVSATVAFAGAHGMKVGVQGSGHSPVSLLAGDILVVTRHLEELTIHPDGRWARVGAGVAWSRVIHAAAPFGLAPLNGSSSAVGVVGYTSGGGVGPMLRSFGIASDRVRALEVITGDGVVRRATPDDEPELFFALRGGKGAGGIVTAIEFDLLPLARFYGGAIYFADEDVPRIIDRWRTWSAGLPEKATTSFAILQIPQQAPGAPPLLAGRMVLSIRFVFVGDPREGARLLEPMRAVAPVLLDDAADKPYRAVDSVHADPVDPMPASDRAMLLTGFPDEAASRLLELAGPGSGSPQTIVEVRQLGGAYSREGPHPSAFVHRSARHSVFVVGVPPSPEIISHAERLQGALGEWDTGGIWPNFGPAYDDVTARRAYDEPTLARLRAVVRRYDPDGVLTAGAFTREAAAIRG